ncbi:MAG: tape measure protein [Microthrixaceae bacterium]|nr:tape measure protein [Microthrixaceae bacterium]
MAIENGTGDFVIDVDLALRDLNSQKLIGEINRKANQADAAFSRLGEGLRKGDKYLSSLAAGAHRLTADLTKAGRETITLEQAMREVGSAVSSIDQGLKNLQSEIVKSKTLQRQAIISQRAEQDRARQAELEATRSANAKLNIEAQRAAQSQVIAQRQAGQQRLQITRYLFENIARLERGIGAAVAGTARTVVASVGRAFDSLVPKFRSSNRVFTDGISTSLSQRESVMRRSFSRQERLLSESLSRQESTVRRINQRISTGVTGAVTGRGVGAGIAGVTGSLGVFGLLSSGFQRFSNLERINKQFLALTGSIESTNLLLEQVKEFAKKTPFDLVGVADLAKGFLAIGTSTEDVLPRVQAIADAVALTGGGVDELNRIQRAIGQVVSAGRLQGDELNQLAENLPGLNIRQILADQLTGGNVRQLVEMQEAGEITSDLFVNGLITGLQNDQRLVGASEDLANTLSGRVANLKESFADFGASIIGVIAEPLKAATTIAQNALQGLADFIKGDVSPALDLVRQGLKGAVIGLGAVVAVKGSIEFFRLLATTASLVLTPMGALLTAAAAIGAVFNLMYTRSPQLRMAIEALGDRFRTVADNVGDGLAPVLAAVANFATNTVLPALDRLASFLAANLLDAFDAVSSFITDTALPALASFGNFVLTTAAPAIVAAGEFIAAAFRTATDALTEFAQIARPYIQPAIDGFQSLGKAIGDAFGGDFSNLASGAGGAAAGIGVSIAKIATTIGQALAPVGLKIIASLKNIFTEENLVEVGKAALKVIETIGYVLGNIVSDPKFITALAAVAAAAALVALRFAEGVAKGVAENLPELLSLALGALKKVGSTLIAEVLFDPGVLALALTGALLAPKLIGAYKSFGEQGAAGFAQGFKSKLRSQGDFLQGLFGGPRSVTNSATSKLFTEAQAQAATLQRTLRAFGSSTEVLLSPKSMKAATEEVENLTRGLSDAQVQGVLMRRSLGDAFAAVRTGASGVTTGVGTITGAFGDIGRRIGQSLQRASNALFEFAAAGTRNQGIFRDVGIKAGDGVSVGFLERMRTGAGEIWDALQETFSGLQDAAAGNGEAIGSAIATGLTVGLASFVAGRAEGQAGGSGALSAIGAGLTGLAVGGPIVGAAAAGISFVGTMFGKAAKKAADMKQRVADLAGTLKGELANGLKVGADGLASLVESLDAAGFATKVGDSLKSVQGDLLDLGITLEDVLSGFKAGDGGLDALGARVLGSDADHETKMKLLAALERSYGDVRQAVEDFNTERTFTGEAARDRSLSAEAARLEALAARYGEVVPAAGELNTIFGEEVQPRFTEAMNAALDAAKLKADEVSQAIDRIFGNRDPEGLAASLDAAIVNVAGSFQGLTTEGGIIDQANLNRALDNLRVQLSDATKAGINEGAIYDEQTLRTQTLSILGAALDGVENQSLRDAIAQTYEDGVANALPTLNTQNIFDQLAAGLSEEEVVVPATLDNRALSAEAARLAAQAKQYGTTAGANYGDGLDSGIRQKVEKARRAAAAIAAAVQDTVNNWWDINSPSKVAMEQGGFYTEGLAIGIGANSAMAAQAAQQAAMSTINSFGGTSVLASAQDAGLTIGQAIANGLADAEADMTSVVSNAVEALLKQISTLGSASKDAATNAAALLFGGITGSDRVGLGGIGAGTTGAGVGAITGSLGSFLSTFDSNVSRIFEVNAKKLGDLTAADREVYGTNVFSLDPNSVFGASNLSAITDFLDNVASLGESLIAQGQPLDQVRTTLEGYIDDLITTASNLGFNRDQLLGLIDQLGLSDAALAEFIKQVDALNAAAAGAPSATPATSSTVDPGADYLTLPRVVYDQTFVVNLPTGDPYAAAVTIANQQAQAAQLPGG